MGEESSAGSATSTTATPVEPATTDTSAPQDGALKAARDEAAKNRVKAREAKERVGTLQNELDTLKAQQAKILQAAGLDDGGDSGPDLEAIQRKATEREQKARDALIRSEAKTKAIAEGIRADRVDQALKLADFSGVDADLETLEVTGVDDAISKVLEEMPELKNGNTTAPGTDKRPPGSPQEPSFDFKNVKRGDIRRLYNENPQQCWKYMDEGFVVKLRSAAGDEIPVLISSGGSGFTSELEQITKLARGGD